ncbi:hypothetical protein HDV06_006212 [Boothiomyces sp. JEL0866]|nr:hypothetical protein HDV06_006212 [Boothiomyces sp. JEL0866]
MSADNRQAIVILSPINDAFVEKRIVVKQNAPQKIGRKVSAKTAPEANNGYFDAKVLSRVHAELSFSKNTVWIQDLKSSNGTFVNGERLSEEGMLSTLKPLRSGDTLEFGVDIRDDDGKVLYNKVSTNVTIEIVLGPAVSPVTSAVNPTATLKSKTDAEAILSIISDEKTISLEAAETLKKIQSSFDYIEKSALSVGKKKEDLPTDFSKTITEMNERLAALKDVVDQHNIDLKSYQEFKPQDSVDTKADVSLLAEELKKSINDLRNETESDLTKLRLEIAKLSSDFDEKLTAANNDLKAQMDAIQGKVEAGEKENQGLKSSIDTLKSEFTALSNNFNAEKTKNEKLSSQIQSLSKTVQEQGKSIEKLRLVEHSPVKQNNLVAYMIIGLASIVLTATVLTNPLVIEKLINIIG